jgi:hypothetical protein
MEDLYPSIVVEGSHRETGRITRAWKKNRPKALAFSSQAAGLSRQVREVGDKYSEVLIWSSAADE